MNVFMSDRLGSSVFLAVSHITVPLVAMDAVVLFSNGLVWMHLFTPHCSLLL